jgi:hypothetical protein
LGFYKNIKLTPTVLAIGRTQANLRKPIKDKDGEAVESMLAQGGEKAANTKEFEVSFIPSPKEYERLILDGYPDNEAGMMIKESLLGGGEVAPRSKNKFEEGLLNR